MLRALLLLVALTSSALGQQHNPRLNFPYFEKTGGALDLMGVQVTRTQGSQTVWAPGESGGQEYAGGWVTPGDYDLSLVAAKVHHEKNGSIADGGQLRTGHNLWGVVVDHDIDWEGWINHGSTDDSSVQLSNWGTSKTVTLAAGDTMHVAYGAGPGPSTGRNGSDGIVVHCVAEEPEYRGGLWGTTDSPSYDEDIWDDFVRNMERAAALKDEPNQWISLPEPMPTDWFQIGTTSGVNAKNFMLNQCAKFLELRALEYLEDPGQFSPSEIDEFHQLLQYALNQVQWCFCWSRRTFSHNHYAHGPSGYPPTHTGELVDKVFLAAVALEYTPDYEPLYRCISMLAQRLDMTVSKTGTYVWGNNTVEGGISQHLGETYADWVYTTMGHTSVGAKGSHRMEVWGRSLWARRLLGYPDTDATAEMLTSSGWGNPPNSQEGNEWHPDGICAGWSHVYASNQTLGAMYLWFTGIEIDSNLQRWARRCCIYDPNLVGWSWGDHLVANAVQEWFVSEPVNLSASAGTNVYLDWDDVPDSDLSHYNVYRGTSPSNLVLYGQEISTSSMLDTSVTSGQTYYYAVRAYDTDENFGVRSEVLQVDVP